MSRLATPTASERAEFRAFCRSASDAQLREIIAKESAAGRRTYAAIARDEAARRPENGR